MASNNKRAAAYLRRLAKVEAPFIDASMGICWNLQHWMRCHGVASLVVDGKRRYDAYSVVENGAIGWPHHSGRRAYPVPCKFHGTPDKWSGEQGQLRRELCLYLATRLEVV